MKVATSLLQVCGGEKYNHHKYGLVPPPWFHSNVPVALPTITFALSVQMPTEYWCFLIFYYCYNKNSFWRQGPPPGLCGPHCENHCNREAETDTLMWKLCNRPVDIIKKFRLQWSSSPLEWTSIVSFLGQLSCSKFHAGSIIP